MEGLIEILLRWFAGAILVFFALAPGWIGFDILYQVVVKPSELDLTAVVAMAVCFSLVYFLLLLAYRAFTGRGRKADGGLLPPWAMQLFVAAFGVLGVLVALCGVYAGKAGAAFGGLTNVAVALVLYGFLKWRQSQRKFNA